MLRRALVPALTAAVAFGLPEIAPVPANVARTYTYTPSINAMMPIAATRPTIAHTLPMPRLFLLISRMVRQSHGTDLHIDVSKTIYKQNRPRKPVYRR